MDKLPQLILIIGVAGSGKSEVGKQVAKRMKYVYLDKDSLTRPFTETFLNTYALEKCSDDRESEFYIKNVRPLEYLISLDVAEENIRLGNSVIISAPFLGEAKKGDWLKREIMITRGLMDKVGIKVILIESDRTTERKRLIQRNEGRDKWKLSHWEEYCSGIQDFQVAWEIQPQYLFRFDNRETPSIPFNRQMDELIQWIQS